MIRILFVDDELNVLQAMTRALRCMKDEWSMEFVSSGAAALQSLAKTPADVIVSDMRMPGMDGWQLLAEVKNLYPQTVRLVLSGYAEPGAIMRLVGTAHQYIAKPGERQSLKTAIAQTQLMRSLLSNSEIAQLVGNVGTLPSFPKAFQEISTCLREPNATLADAARIISRDVAMTANVMKLVNSAFFGARRQISSVDRAVAYLGFDTLSALALGHGLFQTGSSATEALWQHSLKTAMTSRAIALQEQLPVLRVEEAFLAGMLHDIGRLLFAVPDDSASGADAKSHVRAHHAEAGGYLLGLWAFPSHIVSAVAQHHTPHLRVDPGLDLTVLVHIANRLVQWQGAGSPNAEALGIEAGLLESLHLSDRLPHWLAAAGALNVEQEAS